MYKKETIFAEKDRQLAEKDQKIAELLERILELERRLGLNSRNSSKPPASDGYRKPRPQSLRSVGKKASGGQKGHVGKTLSQVSDPDKIEIHRAEKCARCACGHRNTGQFPRGVDAPVQYGPRVCALGVYLSVQQMIPEDRLQGLFLDIFELKIATSTLVRIHEEFSGMVSQSVESTLNDLKMAPVKHLDETGIRIGGKTQWLHVISTDKQTHYRVSPKRGHLLEGLQGTIVHDHWKPYFTLNDVTHALCNAHHLRELKALEEIEKEPWAAKMKKMLITSSKANGRRLKKSLADYDKIVQEGLAYHDSKPPLVSKRKKRRPGHNLLLRFKNFKNDVLRFLTHPNIPFTNNQAEQDIRMMKVKQKISGSFRTQLGAEIFCTIRSFLSTSRKQNESPFASIVSAYG